MDTNKIPGSRVLGVHEVLHVVSKLSPHSLDPRLGEVLVMTAKAFDRTSMP